ncbi:MAG: O-antigen ligase family protein [Pyrinomonadaceae bacterium]
MQYDSSIEDSEGVFRRRQKPPEYADPSFVGMSASRKPATGEQDPAKTVLPRNQTTNSEPLNQRRHKITFISLLVFTVMLYFRPWELVSGLASFTSMAFYSGIITLLIYLITQISTDGNLTARPREIVLVGLLMLAALLSMPMAIDRPEAWKTFTDIFIKAVLIFIVIVNVVTTERRLRALLLLSLAVSVYLSVNAIYDYQHGIFGLGKVENNDLRIAGSIRGLFENSNDLAMHLCTMLPISIAMALEKPGLFRRICYLAVSGLMVAGIVVTFSRGGFIALVVTVIVLGRKLGRRNTMLTAAGVFIGLVLFLALLPGGYSGRVATIFNSAADLTGSSTQRTEILKRSIAVALRYPLFGVGMGNFHYKSFHELQTHNAYTQVASEMGLAAFVIYVMFLVHPLRRLREIERTLFDKQNTSNVYYLAIALQVSLIAYMVASFFGAVAYQWYVYYLVGYAVVLRRVYYAETPLPGSYPLNAMGEENVRQLLPNYSERS